MIEQQLSALEKRIASLQGALKIFSDHPIFGGGLGLFVAERLRQFGKTLVIHSTPLWLLAETGVVGLFVVATLFARVLISEFRRVVRGDSIALLIVLILMVLGIISLLLWIAAVILWIVLLVKAFQGNGQRFEVPILGGVITPYAEQLANAVH